MSGMIYTFYSYKGGVGRSMALANLGMHFYKQGYTTLIVDWDLEAPGVERYFEQRFKLNLMEIAERPGLVDMIQRYKDIVSQPASGDDKTLHPPLEDYLFTIDSDDNCRLLLLHAGRRGQGKLWQNYANFVQNFDWAEFYEEWEGGTYLEWMRGRFKDLADIILIDSRTGVTEMGGVTTQHLADVVLLFCGANFENIENTARMGRNFVSDVVQEARNDRPLDVIVIPSRIDDADSEGFGEFLERINSAFLDIPMRVLDDGYALTETLIPYLPAFSYRETMIIDSPDLEKTASRIIEAYRRIAANMRLLAHDGSVLVEKSPGTLKVPKSHVLLLSSSRETEIADKISKDLQSHGVQVKDATKSRTDIFELEQELNQISSVVILVSESMKSSRVILRLITVILDTGKPIIPVIIDDGPMPFELADLQAVDLRINYADGINAILRVVRQERTSSDQFQYSQSRKSGKMIYLSYSRRDQEIVQIVRENLSASGYHLWNENEGILPGSQWQREIENALREAVALIVFVTHASMESQWVQREITYMDALRKPVIPVVIGGVPLPFSLAHIQSITIHDTDIESIKKAAVHISKTLNQILS